MSIFIWREWDVIYDKSYPLGYALLGHFSVPWLPWKVQQAKCDVRTLTPAVSWEDFFYSADITTVPVVDATIPRHAQCNTPDEKCTCGIYGYSRHFVPMHCTCSECVFDRPLVLGIAEVWGKIIVAEYGYRAQFAKIRALVDAYASIAIDYGVPNLPTVEYAQKEFFS
jgi:hypothetical protein